MRFLLVIVMFVAGSVRCREVWIDPHDMNIDLSSKLHSALIDGYCENKNCQCPDVDNRYVYSHYRRTISRILKAVTYNRNDENHYRGTIELNIKQEDYDFLNAFAKGSDESPEAFRAVDKILDGIFKVPSHKFFAEALLTWTDHLYFTFYNRTTGILIASLFVVFVSYKLLRASFTLWTVIKYIIFVAWVLDSAFTWNRLLQEHEINQMADTFIYDSMPAHCKRSEMSWWGYIFTTNNQIKDECRKYHKTRLENILWKVSPIEIISHQIGVIILTPASYIGKAIGDITSGILNSLPFGLNLVVLPLLLVFLLILVCMVLTFATNRGLRINLFHLLKLDFGNNERQSMGNVITGDNLSKMLDLIQRNTIEDIKETNNGSSNTSIESSISSAPPIAISETEKQESIKPKEENTDSASLSCKDDCSQENAFNNAIENVDDTHNKQQKDKYQICDKTERNDGSGDASRSRNNF